jgi:hypothetical protein
LRALTGHAPNASKFAMTTRVRAARVALARRLR